MSTTPVKQPVIGDVARAAGVSVPTVSRVLTGAARVSEAKRLAVVAAIEQLGYRPSAAARALVSGQPRLISILAGNTSRYGYAKTIRGVEEAARSVGYTVTITVVESDDDEVVERAVNAVLGQPIAGIVLLKFDRPGVAALDLLRNTAIPTVSVSGLRDRDRGVPQAVLNEAAAAHELVSHLLDLGHATVHHVRVPPSRKEDGRTSGWRRALLERGSEVPTEIDASWEPESGRQIGLELADRDDVTAVFCGNDEIAMGVIRGLNQSGRRVPEDVSVVGFDDHPLAAIWSPPLTTVRQDFAGLGGRSFRLLESLLRTGDATKFSSARLPLVIRESSGPPPAR